MLVVVVAVVGVLVGLGHSWMSTRAPGLSPADRARIEANAVGEALYNSSFILPGLVLLAASAWTKRRSQPPADE